MALAKQYDVMVVHDLAYADIVYDGWKAPSIMQVPGAKDIAVEFFTLSKSYNMAGWRIGFMVGNPERSRPWRGSRATTTTAPSRPCRWRPLPLWKATSSASAISPGSTSSAATSW